MAQKTKKSTTASKSKTASKETSAAPKRQAATKPSEQAPDLVNTVTAGTYVAPGSTDDVAVLSASQEAQAFDMSNSNDPASDLSAALDARSQGALEPVGTQAATEPIITEDGVVVRNS